jgi:hypothetical protein
VESEVRVPDGVRMIAEAPHPNIIKVLETVPSGELVTIGFSGARPRHDNLESAHSSLSKTETWIVIFHALFAL